MVGRIWNWMFGCRHKELSRVFTTEGETYKICLKCGTRLPYSLETMQLVPERRKRTNNSRPDNRQRAS